MFRRGYRLWADDVTTTGTLEKVWAVITPPGYGPGLCETPEEYLPILRLNHVGGGRYENAYGDFNTKGTYHAAERKQMTKEAPFPENARKKTSDYRIAVVIPTVNEEITISQIIQGCIPHADEVLVVDGHSKDRTREIAEGLGVKVVLDHGKGKGEALRYSVSHVTADIIVFIDADGSHDPNDIPKLIQPIADGKADHVSGSRLIGGSSELHGGFDECFRLMGSSFITACINWKFNVCLSESQNGFRAIKTDVIKQLDLKENITTIEQEMIIKTLKKGFRMAEVPTHEHKRVAGYSKITLRKVWFRYVFSVVKYLFF